MESVLISLLVGLIASMCMLIRPLQREYAIWNRSLRDAHYRKWREAQQDRIAYTNSQLPFFSIRDTRQHKPITIKIRDRKPCVPRKIPGPGSWSGCTNPKRNFGDNDHSRN